MNYEPPEDVLARLDRDVESLRRRGFAADADRMGVVADEFRAAIDPVRLVSEHTAMTRSGKSKRWLRDRFPSWERTGAAELRGTERWYRLCVLPAQVAMARGEAEADAVLGRTG